MPPRPKFSESGASNGDTFNNNDSFANTNNTPSFAPSATTIVIVVVCVFVGIVVVACIIRACTRNKHTKGGWSRIPTSQQVWYGASSPGLGATPTESFDTTSVTTEKPSETYAVALEIMNEPPPTYTAAINTGDAIYGQLENRTYVTAHGRVP